MPNLILRDARPPDRSAIIAVLAAAFADSDVGRWLDADAGVRAAYFGGTVDSAFAYGIPRVATDRDEIVGAALWFPCPSDAAVTAAPLPAASVVGAVLERLRVLERLLDERHPRTPAHHHLAHLGVRPDRQRQGIGSYLLIAHHAYLHVAGIPAYLAANDPSNHEFCLRHGYSDVGSPILLPTGLPVWPMWREPVPAASVPASSVPRPAHQRLG